MLNDLANRALKAGISVMGEPITLTRGGTAYPLKGLFQETFKQMDPDTGFPVTTLQPLVSLAKADLDFTPKVGDLIAARGVNYRIRDIQSDGHTGLELMLQRTSARS